MVNNQKIIDILEDLIYYNDKVFEIIIDPYLDSYLFDLDYLFDLMQIKDQELIDLFIQEIDINYFISNSQIYLKDIPNINPLFELLYMKLESFIQELINSDIENLIYYQFNEDLNDQESNLKESYINLIKEYGDQDQIKEVV